MISHSGKTTWYADVPGSGLNYTRRPYAVPYEELEHSGPGDDQSIELGADLRSAECTQPERLHGVFRHASLFHPTSSCNIRAQCSKCANSRINCAIGCVQCDADSSANCCARRRR